MLAETITQKIDVATVSRWIYAGKLIYSE